MNQEKVYLVYRYEGVKVLKGVIVGEKAKKDLLESKKQCNLIVEETKNLTTLCENFEDHPVL